MNTMEVNFKLDGNYEKYYQLLSAHKIPNTLTIEKHDIYWTKSDLGDKTEEQIDEERRKEQEEYTRRIHEEKRKQKEKEQKEKAEEQKINNKTKYFNGCFTVDELNKRKKELLKQYHPDNHNNDLEKKQCEEISKQINEEFVLAKNAILNDFDI